MTTLESLPDALQRWYRGLPVVMLTLSMVSPAWPQDGPAHETVLELKVDAADVVVRGTVLTVERHEAGEFHEVAVTVKVLETIKGGSRSTLEFSESDIGNSNRESIFKETYYNNWRTAGYEFLWFLRKPAAGKSAFSAPLDGESALIPLAYDIRPLTPAIFPSAYVTADLRVLRNPDEILAAARKAAAHKVAKIGECAGSTILDWPGCAVGVPYRMMARPRDGYVQYLHMPVDERMETLCRRMIQRPDDLWTIPAANSFRSYEVPDLEKVSLVREQGVRCLRSFRSEPNIQLLQIIAKEGPASSTPSYRGPRFDPATAAAETLKSWEIPVQ